jgi:hypothetical protein
MRHIWVRYMNGASDVVGQKMLNELLAGNEIAQFYRPSESRWVTLGVDLIRGTGGRYVGPDRRIITEPEPQRWVNSPA